MHYKIFYIILFAYFQKQPCGSMTLLRRVWELILDADLYLTSLRATVPPIEKCVYLFLKSVLFLDLFLHIFKLQSQNITNNGWHCSSLVIYPKELQICSFYFGVHTCITKKINNNKWGDFSVTYSSLFLFFDFGSLITAKSYKYNKAIKSDYIKIHYILYYNNNNNNNIITI